MTNTIAAGGEGAAAVDDLVPLLPWLVRATGEGLESVDIVPIERIEPLPGGVARLAGRGELFVVEARCTPLAASGGWAVELDVWLPVERAEPIAAALTFALQVDADREPRWLIPGIFYGENRPAESRGAYPRWVAASADGDPFASPDWWFRSDRAATPAVFASGGGRRIGLATTELSPLGLTGVGFGTVAGEAGIGGAGNGEVREIRLSFPYREAPLVYDGSPTPGVADVPVHRWEPGSSVRLDLRAFAGPDTPHASAPILRGLRGWLAPNPRPAPPVRAEEAASLAADGLLRWHWRPADRALIETAAFDRRGDGTDIEAGDRLAMHVAWLSGAPTAAALVAHGRRAGRTDAVDAGAGVLDAIASNRARCGTFWGQWTAERGWGKGWSPGPDALHGRTIAEATLFMARAAAAATADASAAAADAPGEPAGSRWRRAVEANLDFILDAERDGDVPSVWNGRTGAALARSGSARLAWVPALVEGARLMDRRDWTDAARRIGERHAGDVDRELLFGAPEDVDLGPTSEDGYVAVMAYVALAKCAAGGDERRRWTALAAAAADWTLSFRYAYDVSFPPDSRLGRRGVGTRGADVASPANQHLHTYGLICTRDLLDLTGLTGDDHYAVRARETYAFARQLVAREDGDLGGRRGMAPERAYQTRYDGEKGEIGPLSHAWCLGLLLDASELAIARPELAIDG